jgi:hypothetical protein
MDNRQCDQLLFTMGEETQEEGEKKTYIVCTVHYPDV